MKIIFLDIDGVLNCWSRKIPRVKTERSIHFYSEELVANLNELIEKTDAEIVVSSTWRLGETVESMSAILKKIGVAKGCIGITPRFFEHGSLRGNEILYWIKTHVDTPCHEYKSYVILDDDSDMLYCQKDNFIHVDGEFGLTKRDVLKAIRILNKCEC